MNFSDPDNGQEDGNASIRSDSSTEVIRKTHLYPALKQILTDRFLPAIRKYTKHYREMMDWNLESSSESSDDSSVDSSEESSNDDENSEET